MPARFDGLDPGQARTAEERWDRRFSEHAWPSDPDPYLVELARPLPPGRGLDLGAGPGRNSLWLAALGWDMTLVDVSRVGLEQAVTAAAALPATISTVHADLDAWRSEEDGFDLVIVANIHPGSGALPDLLSNAARALRPDGHLYVVGHDLSNLGVHGPPDPDRLLTVDRLRAALPDQVRAQVLETRLRVPDHGQAGRPERADRVVLAWATKVAGSDRTHR